MSAPSRAERPEVDSHEARSKQGRGRMKEQDEAPCLQQAAAIEYRGTLHHRGDDAVPLVPAHSSREREARSRIRRIIPMDISPPRSRGSLLEALDELRLMGFGASFEYDHGKLRCVESGSRYEPDDVRVLDIRRFEGQSDPDDLAVLYVLKTLDGKEGVFVDAFGPQADPGAGEFLSHVPDLR